MKKFYIIGLMVLATAQGVTAENPCVAPAAITGQSANLCGAKTVSFTASTVAGATAYNWTVPSGFTLLSGQGTTTISIKSPVNFTTAELKVSATTSCGTSAATILTLNGAPGDLSAEMTGPSVLLSGSGYDFSLPATSGLSYSWVADGGSVVGGWGSNSVHIVAGTINGYVRATVKNACGTGPVAKKYFTIDPASCVAPDRIVGQPSDLCGGKTVVYQVTRSIGATSYDWTVPAGFTIVSGQGTQTLRVTTPILFTTGVLKVAAVGACGRSPETTLTLSGAPGDLSGSIMGPDEVLKGSTNTFSLPTSGLSYSWVADGSSVVGGWGTNTVSIKAGIINGYVKVTVKNACGTGPVARKYFTVKDPVTCTAPELNYVVTNPLPCPGSKTGAVNVTATGGTGPFTYNWTGPDGFTSSSEDISSLGWGSYFLDVTTPGGCKTDLYVFVGHEFEEVQPPYPVSGQKDNLCNGKVVSYTATAVDGATAYNWSVDPGFTILSGQGTQTVTVKAPPTFTTAYLRVNATLACGNTGDREIQLWGTPFEQNIEMTGPLNVVTGSVNVYSIPSVPGVSLSWVADGGSVVGGWGSTSASIKAGIIDGYVKVRGTNACGSGIIAQKYFFVQPAAASVASSSQLEIPKASFRVYPNPVRDQATVIFETEVNNAKYEVKVVDMYGRILSAKQGIAFAGTNTIRLNFSGYAKGIYLVNLTTGGKTKTIKLVKSN